VILRDDDADERRRDKERVERGDSTNIRFLRSDSHLKNVMFVIVIGRQNNNM